MKKLKKTIVILLCLCMLAGTAVIGVSAYTDEDQKIQQLFYDTEELYSLGKDKFPARGWWDYDSIYTDQTLYDLNLQLENAEKYMDPYIWESTPVEELQGVYDGLEAAYDGLKVKADALQELYDAVKGEEDGTEGYLPVTIQSGCGESSAPHGKRRRMCF